MFERWKDIQRNIGCLSEGEMKGFSNKIIWLVYIIILQNSFGKETTNIKNNQLNYTDNIKNGIFTNKNKILYQNNSNSVNIGSRNIGKSKNLKGTLYLPLKKSVNFGDSIEVDQYSFSRKMFISKLKRLKQEILEEFSQKTRSGIFLSEKVNTKHASLMNYNNLDFSKNEPENLLAFKENYFHNESLRKQLEMMKNYRQFQNLLWFYYYYDQDAYRSLIELYKERLQSHLLNSLGLPSVETTKGNKQKLQKNEGTFLEKTGESSLNLKKLRKMLAMNEADSVQNNNDNINPRKNQTYSENGNFLLSDKSGISSSLQMSGVLGKERVDLRPDVGKNYQKFITKRKLTFARGHEEINNNDSNGNLPRIQQKTSNGY